MPLSFENTEYSAPPIFIHVLSPIVPEFPLPKKLDEHSDFDRASDEQIEHIKNKLPLPVSPVGNLYESEITRTGSRCYSQATQPDRRQWRYFVINVFGGKVQGNYMHLKWAFNLTEQELETGFVFSVVAGGVGVMGHPYGVYSFLESVDPVPVILPDVFFDEAMGIYAKLEKTCSIHIKRALHHYEAIKGLPRSDDMMVLGLFAVLESLITHNPRSAWHGDSLTHQVSTKMPLLCKRFKLKDDLALASDAKAWCELYDWRSKIAHGERLSVNRARFKILGNREAALAFLKRNLRRLLLLVLDEPDLIEDLRAC